MDFGNRTCVLMAAWQGLYFSEDLPKLAPLTLCAISSQACAPHISLLFLAQPNPMSRALSRYIFWDNRSPCCIWQADFILFILSLETSSSPDSPKSRSYTSELVLFASCFLCFHMDFPHACQAMLAFTPTPWYLSLIDKQGIFKSQMLTRATYP